VKGTDSIRFAETLDDIEEVLNAQEVFQESLQTQVVAENVKVLLDSRLPNGRHLRTAR
jgi:hypothetical protein